MRKTGFKTDALARCLALKFYPIFPVEEPKHSEEEIARATERLDAMPADEQLLTFCDSMGFNVIEFLREKAKFDYECQNPLPDTVEYYGG